MDRAKLKNILKKYRAGKVSEDEVISGLELYPFDMIEDAVVDTHRGSRKGFPEVVFCQGKTPLQVMNILKSLIKNDSCVLASRASKELYKKVKKTLPRAEYFEKASVIKCGSSLVKYGGRVIVVSAGTSDIPVAEEAFVTAEAFGVNVERLYDVGVAGLHRLLGKKDMLEKADAVIVVAGMDGALPSVIGGLVSSPVIAVPTSVGYGASFGGVAALFTMLNSCAPVFL